MDYSRLSKKAKSVMFLTALIQGLCFAAVCLGVVALNFGRYSFFGTVILISGALLTLLYVIVVPLVRYRRYRYLITPDRIEIVEGVIRIRRTIVPVDRIHQISVSRGPLDTAFGVAKVSVITAGATATMRFLEEEKADEIALYLNNCIKEKLGGEDDVQ